MHSCTSLWNVAMGMLARGHSVGLEASGQPTSPPAVGEWTCLRQGTEQQEEGARGWLLLKTRPDDDWGPAEGCTLQASTPTCLLPLSHPFLVGCSVHACTASCGVWEGHVNGGRRKLDSLSAGRCYKRGRLDQELKPSRPHQAESGDSKLALPGSRAT